MMGIRYDISVFEIVKLLKCPSPTSKQRKRKHKEQKLSADMPSVLSDFLSLIANNPLFETSDIWTNYHYFFYEAIAERIEDDKEYRKENPDECADDEYYQFSLLPRETWPDKLPNYLVIGSDYGSGVVIFGIADVDKDAPSVFEHHEENELTEWNLLNDNLYDFLMMVTCDVLSCAAYDTAKEVLTKSGWVYQTYTHSDDVKRLLSEAEIDISKAPKYISTYGTSPDVYCCFDDVKNTLYVIRKDENQIEMCIISQ